MKKRNLVPAVCSGTYFPLRGQPERHYFVVLDELVLAGPFKTEREATGWLTLLRQKRIRRRAARMSPSNHLSAKSARLLALVLRQQEKAITAAAKAAS